MAYLPQLGPDFLPLCSFTFFGGSLLFFFSQVSNCWPLNIAELYADVFLHAPIDAWYRTARSSWILSRRFGGWKRDKRGLVTTLTSGSSDALHFVGPP